ncbi:CaiB/BaiF CoA transferase family protein [Sphingomonas paeninsulae]|uniref:CaiB/BaiF CoA transferase family protein n=1 Tax=Sphingomonas paeninsulae TaxID=2319844 RepID=UPI0026786C6F
MIATHLGDFGADVIKVEHPSGDALRHTGFRKDGVPLWWKVGGRNKRSITLDIKRGPDVLKKLVKDADVLIESFRPGTLEKWGVGWEELSAINPRLIMVRVTGFGQTGPYRNRPGFGTLAEAMSGFAHITGEPQASPTLPPFGLADGVAAQYGAFATMFALYERDAKGSGKGQFIDLAIYEPLFALLGYQPTLYDQLGIVQGRTGNRSQNNAPRNTYKTRDGRWVALSASTPSIADRVLRLAGGDAFAADPRFATAAGRVAAIDEIDRVVGGWIAARDLTEVIRIFEEYEGAIAPVYDIAQIFEDPQYAERSDIIAVNDTELGSIKMQNVFPRLSRTPGKVRHTGPRVGEHNEEVYRELGLDADQIALLHEGNII